jgi:hypothetical protein
MMEICDKGGPQETKNEGRNSMEIAILLEERQLGNMQRDFNNRFVHDLTTLGNIQRRFEQQA